MADEEQDEKDEGPDEQEVREESEPRLCLHCKADLAQPAGKKVFSIIVLLFVAAVVVFGVWAAFFTSPTQKPTPGSTSTTTTAPTTAPS